MWCVWWWWCVCVWCVCVRGSLRNCVRPLPTESYAFPLILPVLPANQLRRFLTVVGASTSKTNADAARPQTFSQSSLVSLCNLQSLCVSSAGPAGVQRKDAELIAFSSSFFSLLASAQAESTSLWMKLQLVSLWNFFNLIFYFFYLFCCLPKTAPTCGETTSLKRDRCMPGPWRKPNLFVLAFVLPRTGCKHFFFKTLGASVVQKTIRLPPKTLKMIMGFIVSIGDTSFFSLLLLFSGGRGQRRRWQGMQSLFFSSDGCNRLGLQSIGR